MKIQVLTKIFWKRGYYYEMNYLGEIHYTGKLKGFIKDNNYGKTYLVFKLINHPRNFEPNKYATASVSFTNQYLDDPPFAYINIFIINFGESINDLISKTGEDYFFTKK